MDEHFMRLVVMGNTMERFFQTLAYAFHKMFDLIKDLEEE
jgi:hypothetical protein